jgi:hypothetical protein
MNLDDYFARHMPDVEAWLAEHAAEPVTGQPEVAPLNPPEPTPGGFLVPPGFTAQLAAYFREHPADPDAWADLPVRKLAGYIEVSDDLAMDAGLIPDTRPKPPPPSWRTRFRWKRAEWRERAARRAYKIIAGDWPDDREDDW